jgi:hypothetical protein
MPAVWRSILACSQHANQYLAAWVTRAGDVKLLAVDDPFVAIAFGFCAEVREVATSTWFTEQLTADDVTHIFPGGAPAALYAKQNQSSARALKAVLALETLDVQRLINEPVVEKLSDDLIADLRRGLDVG